MARPRLIDLSLGAPGFPAPAVATEAAARAAAAGGGGYAPMGGIPRLREALAGKLTRANQLPSSGEQVVVTNGASQAIYATLATLCGTGDTVLVPEPGFPLYRLAAHTIGLRTVGYALPDDCGHAPDWTQLGRLAATAKVLIWNYPSNPLGAVGRPEWYASLYALLAEHPDLHVINDAVYEDLVLEPAEPPPAVPAEVADRVVSVFSFSKAYGLTGMRIGYLHACAALAQRIARAHWGMSMSSSAIGQVAALAALGAPEEYLAGNRSLLRDQRDYTVDVLRALGLECQTPQAGLFAWVWVGNTGHDDLRWVTGCATLARVLLNPGRDFAPAATDRVRFSFAGRRAELEEALRRVAAWGEAGWPTQARELVDLR